MVSFRIDSDEWEAVEDMSDEEEEEEEEVEEVKPVQNGNKKKAQKVVEKKVQPVVADQAQQDEPIVNLEKPIDQVMVFIFLTILFF